MCDGGHGRKHEPRGARPLAMGGQYELRIKGGISLSSSMEPQSRSLAILIVQGAWIPFAYWIGHGHESHDRVDRSRSVARSIAKIGSQIESHRGITMGREIDRRSPWDRPPVNTVNRQQWSEGAMSGGLPRPQGHPLGSCGDCWPSRWETWARLRMTKKGGHVSWMASMGLPDDGG